MKQLIICLLLLGFAACKDEKKLPEPATVILWKESGSATINGIDWMPTFFKSSSFNAHGTSGDSVLSIGMSVMDTNNFMVIYQAENLFFRDVRKNKSQQRVDTMIWGQEKPQNVPGASFHTIVDVDQINERYGVCRADSLNNWIQITDEQNNYGEIKGAFSITLIKTDDAFWPKYPDTLRIRNGKFTIKVNQ